MPTIFKQKRKTFAGFKTKGYDYTDRANKNNFGDTQPRSNPLDTFSHAIPTKKPQFQNIGSPTIGHVGHINTRGGNKINSRNVSISKTT